MASGGEKWPGAGAWHGPGGSGAGAEPDRLEDGRHLAGGRKVGHHDAVELAVKSLARPRQGAAEPAFIDERAAAGRADALGGVLAGVQLPEDLAHGDAAAGG
jgi:hypothetical protein